jgi:hypothetical protein
VKLQELQIGELQKKIVEGETRLKQQQNLYEAVRSDRNLYSKNLIESQVENRSFLLDENHSFLLEEKHCFLLDENHSFLLDENHSFLFRRKSGK